MQVGESRSPLCSHFAVRTQAELPVGQLTSLYHRLPDRSRARVHPSDDVQVTSDHIRFCIRRI